MSTSFEIEQMTRLDWAKVRAIYAEGLATGLAAFLVHPPIWNIWDAGHLPFGRLVARQDRAILGWAALAPVAVTGRSDNGRMHHDFGSHRTKSVADYYHGIHDTRLRHATSSGPARPPSAASAKRV